MLTPPAADEIEISLLGGGGNYGECILIHAFEDEWIMVDSFINPDETKPAAQLYLESLYGAGWNDKIKMVIATHWHDDHIRGLSAIIEACKISKIHLSTAQQHDRFYQLIGLDLFINSENSGVREFNKILTAVPDITFNLAIEDRVILQDTIGGRNRRLVTLSPSDASVQQAIAYFADQILDSESAPYTGRIKKPDENDQSIVLSFTLGNDHILLGADLEITGTVDRGWERVCQTVHGKQNRSIIYKIPHHGSVNGYLKEVWDDMLEANVYAILSPYKKGKYFLPQPEGIALIQSHTPNSYITSAPGAVAVVKKKSKAVTKLLDHFSVPVRNIPSRNGHVCLRKGIAEAEWKVELSGNAKALV